MKKNVFAYVIATLVCVMLMSCGNENRPLKNLSDYMVDFVEDMRDGKSLNDRTEIKAYEEKRDELCAELEGKTILVEMDQETGYELVENQAVFGLGHQTHIYGDFGVEIPIDFELKMTDPSIAYTSKLMVLFYAGDDVVDARHLSNYRTKINMQKTEGFESSEIKRSYLIITLLLAHRYANVSKLVVTKYDEEKYHEIENENIEIREEIRRNAQKQKYVR